MNNNFDKNNLGASTAFQGYVGLGGFGRINEGQWVRWPLKFLCNLKSLKFYDHILKQWSFGFFSTFFKHNLLCKIGERGTVLVVCLCVDFFERICLKEKERE